jgi:hypothetical protein
LALPTTPQGQQQQQRTFDVLRKPDIFKSYRQSASADERTNAGIRIPDSEHIDELRMDC